MTGHLWVLNLDAEEELRWGEAYSPRAAVEAGVRELSAELVRVLPPEDRVQGLSPAPPPPEALGQAWCPTPRALARLDAAGVRRPAAPSVEVLRRVNHRRFAHELSARLAGARLQGARLVEDPAVLEAVMRRPGEGWPEGAGRGVLKAALGFSGRGLRRFRVGEAPASLVRWGETQLVRDGALVVEPWVERRRDLARHGWLGADGSLHLGPAVAQVCDARGVWRESLPLGRGELSPEWEARLTGTVEAVAEALHEAGYLGPFGVDALVWADPSGEERLHPLVEINARFSMGWWVGLELVDGAGRPRERPLPRVPPSP